FYGHFPRMENIAAFKPVSVSPLRSTCGVPERSSYCQPSSSQTELLACHQAFCVQECPYRSSTPPYAPLLLAAHRRASLFLDGLEADGTPYDTQPLAARLSDTSEGGAMWVGLSANGKELFFSDTSLEIVELFSGTLPELHVQSDCRCPPSHPRVHPLVERYCIPNAVEDTTNDRVLRLNLNAHPLSYINDHDMGTTWLSKVMTKHELDEGVTITVDLANGQYQIFYVIVQFGGLLPESVLIQRRKLDLTEPDSGSATERPWIDWQYMARNCSVFEMQNNEPLQRPDSVNCLQLPSDVPFSGGNITFSLLTTQPNLRPGYNDFYNTRALQQMVQAAQVRIHISGQYHTGAVGVNQRHRYFTISEITISGRCECHGHADHCDTSVTPYRCLCLPESHTQGNNCQDCEPLYNDKPFKSGNQLQPMNCRPCQCHSHALSCHYDISTDDQPDEHYQGGGGVCDNCMHNTTGTISNPFNALNFYDPTIGGQCRCKAAATGRRCAECLPGWFGLQALNPAGCVSCNCSDVGTIITSSVPSCDRRTGRCHCKPHVAGLSCDRCEFGFWNLSHKDGCLPCDCDPLGSISPFCEPEGGQCECQPGVGGQRCDSCGSGLYGLRLEGSCAPCNCSHEGTVPGTHCHPYTGQCVCKEHVEGLRCDSCRRGYHTLEHRNSLGCLPCVCDISGTVPDGVCDMWTGQCPCKQGVEGAQCSNCAPNYHNKSLTHSCVPCVCDPGGTVAGSVCDSATGQCVCLPTRSGKDCSTCRLGFYLSPDRRMCLECDCHPMGASQRGCESQTGQCVCAHPSVGGRRCDQCQEMFSGFNPGLGVCHPCSCEPMGSVNGSCHPDTGSCACKLLVTGNKCDSCHPGASHLDPENHFGCSKAPSQQPAPAGVAISYSSIKLSWHPPDSPNSHKLNYTLVRDGQSVHTIQSQYPFRPESFEDIELFPFTNYSYWLITANVAGTTISASAAYQTLGAPPDADQVHLNLVGRPGPTSAIFNWSTPRNDTGPVERFVLSSTVSSSGAAPTIHYAGSSTEAVASGLKPFSHYTVILEACSSGGCTSSPPLSLLTASAPPKNQPPPRVVAKGPNTLHVSWEPPGQPNGTTPNTHITEYKRNTCTSINWFDPNVSKPPRLTNRNKAAPPDNSTTVGGLKAFSTYQVRVVSINPAGSVTSDWTTARTMEGGLCILLALHRMGPLEQPVYVATGLKPYHAYNFTVTLCTNTGCTTSLPGTGRTLPAAPTGLSSPQLFPINESTIHIEWQPPDQLNGPHPLYQVSSSHIRSETASAENMQTPHSKCPAGVKLSFKTWSADGLLLCAVSPGNQEEFLAIQMRSGIPFFLFDPQGSAVAVSAQGDGGRRYNDGQWHSITATRRGAVGTIVVDDQYRGSASASSGSTIIGDNTGVFVGGLPEDFTVQREDSGSHGFPGCLRDVSFMMTDGPLEEWQFLDWAKATSKVAAYESWEGCPAQTVEGAHFLGHGYLELAAGLFSGGQDFDISMDFRTDQLNALLLFVYNTQTDDYMLVELEAGLLSFTVHSEGHVTELSMWVGLSYCDGDWKQLSLAKRGSLVSAAVDDWAEEARGAGGAAMLRVDSSLYLGGVPGELAHSALDRKTPVSQSVNLSVASRRAVRVYLDGCPTSESRFNCRGNDSVLVYTGKMNQATDYSLQPFTGNRPTSVSPPTRVQSLDGFSAVVSWVPPDTDFRGLIDRYELKAYNIDRPEASPIKATYLANGNFTGKTDTLPFVEVFSQNKVTLLQNYTMSCLYSSCSSLSLVYFVSGLGVYSTHVFVLSACTVAGCTNSSQTTMLTSQLRPGPLQAPTLTLLDSRTIFVEWSRPTQINGVLEFYSIFLSHDGAEPVLAYNSSELFEDCTLRNLTPGTTYTITLAACTGGGCTLSPPSQAQTEESTPENVPAPLVTPLSPHALNVSWTAPDTPNGVITSYGLWLDGVLILNASSSQKFFVVDGLSPWSRHVFRLQACTAQGCGKAPMVSEFRTLELAPEGPILLEMANQSSRSLRARWMAPPRANGNLSYTSIYVFSVFFCVYDFFLLAFCFYSLIHFSLLYYPFPVITPLQGSSLLDGVSSCIKSSFLIPPDGLSPPTLAHATHASLNVSWSAPANANAPGPLFYSLQMRTSPQRPNATDAFSYSVDGLSPYTQYLFRVVVSHLHGQTASPWASMRTAEHRPGLINAPTVSGLHSRSLSITWAPPAQPNGIITHYTLYLHPTSTSLPLSTTVSGNTTDYTFLDLLPYQTYSAQVEACTRVGCSVSELSPQYRTLPAPPEGVPAPHLYSDTPTSVLISWGTPDWLIERRVAGTKQVSTVGQLLPDPPPLSFLDSSSALSPWTSYQYRLVLHNQAGNTTGPWTNVTTRPSRPAGLSPPRVKVSGPETGIFQVTWTPPLIPNGEIRGYEIRLPEPRVFHEADNASELNVSVTDLVPNTNYSVTVLACSNGGGHVGGCTESLPTQATTLPKSPEGLAPLSVVSVSESFLAISWQPPARPNGPNLRYKLLRRKTHQPLAIATAPTLTASSPPPSEDLHRWLHVYSGTKLFYQDKGLSRFTRYQYQLVVDNDAGSSSGEIVTAMTMAGVPLQLPSVSARAINHTAVQVNWTQPSLQDLQGEVEFFFLTVEPPQPSMIQTLGPEIVSTVIVNLWPSTTYLVSLWVSNGAHNTTKAAVNVTTADGEPEGMSAPEVVPVNSSTARVLWFPPLRPNGAVMRYSVYINDHLHGSVDNSSGSYLIGDLLPFTVYDIQVEVCTVYACVRSNVTKTTTVENLPTDFATPQTQVISPRLEWSHPGRPSGIMLGYEVLRRTLRSCAAAPTRVTSFRCIYLQCPASHSVCGSSCFHPDTQICCSGLSHTKKTHHHCCEDNYLSWNDTSTPVCCDGKLLPALSGHQCCGGYYVHVKLNEYCCPDHSQGRVSVGLGDSCCGGVPYSVTGGQLCCSGSLHDGFGVKCCGGRIVDDSLVCCGDAESGEVHNYTPGFVCCGQEYINSSTTLCCMGHEEHPVMHPAGNATVTLQCCGSKVIHQDEECCSGIGYDPQRHVCADRPTPGLPIQAQCLDFEKVLNTHAHSNTTNTPSDPGLEPFTTYEYRVTGWNSFGRGSSNVTAVTTSQDKPWGVAPPHWSRVGERDDIIQLQWQAPARPNGEISHYVVLRDGHERYRGDENSFTDVGGIRPFHEYSYQLRVCNRAGCTDSTQVVAVTVQGVPEDVQPPVVTAVSPFSLHTSWSEPTHPHGIIQRYLLNQTGVGTIFTVTDGARNYTVTGLQPFTEYTFVLVACTAVGCGSSLPVTEYTLQTSPSGVWSRPEHLIINTSAVELYWDQPSQPNGQITQYRLKRDGHTVFSGDHRDQNYTDTGLLPNHRYLYELEANTEGGTGVSDKYVVQTPASCPTGIPPPHSVTVSGPYSISLAWHPPGESQPVNYNILLNPGRSNAVKHRAGWQQHLTVTGLEPFTAYYIRVQACQNEGCGVGQGVQVRTLEAAPEGLLTPKVKAVGPSVLEIRWSPPQKPNGVITSYHVYRRPFGTEEELLVFIWSTGPLDFYDASPSLRPFTYFQYRVRAHNSKGSVLSQWALGQTLEAQPQDMAPPIVTPSGAYSAHLKWSEPGLPNGLISHYRLFYKKHQQDPTLNSTTVTALTVKGSVREASVYGLEPYTQYSLWVEAVNSAGSVSSLWVDVRTLEASPAGLANFTVEQREQGRALLLSWDQPRAPHGVIMMYNIYSEGNLEFSGLSRSFLFRRLEPWTVYSLALEVCTSAGCTHTPPQYITTAAAPPASQLPPRPVFIGADHVSLTWGPPSQPNGPIEEYHLFGRNLEEEARGRSNEEDIKRGKVLFKETSPQQAELLSYTVTGLRPWTQYEFSVCTHNPAGHTCSPWITLTTKQAPPRGLAPPTLSHLQGRPSEVKVSWSAPLEPNGVLQSYRIQRNNVSFSFSFDPTVLSYIDEDLLPFSTYSYSVIACTSEGCIASPHTNITTLEAPPASVEPPTVTSVTSDSIEISWSKPTMENGEVTEYVLKVNNEEAYRGRDLRQVLSDLQPHTSYQLLLLACTSGGCTDSVRRSVVTEEAPPTELQAPTLKVTGPESVEVSWRPPERPNGIITGYELHRDGEIVYVGTDTYYHDFTLLPSKEYSYVVRANNSRGAVSTLTGLQKIFYPVQLTVSSTEFTPEDGAFSDRSTTLHGLAPYHRYEMRLEACTVLGCSSSDWSSVLTLEAPPSGQTAPLLDLQPDSHTGLQTSFLLTWSPPAQPNGRILHYEVHRRLEHSAETHRSEATTVVYKNTSTSCQDHGLQPYTDYQYQVWAVNSAGRAASRWVGGKTGPAPPEGVGLPLFLHVSATSAVVKIHPPARPNGVVSLYRIFSLDHNNQTLLSEGTSQKQTLHGLHPYTHYWVGVEACTCYQCCSQGPLSELHTMAAPPARQPPPRPVALTSRSVQLEWDEPLAPNGVIERWGEILKSSLHSLWLSHVLKEQRRSYVSPFSVDSNLTVIWLDWTGSFALNGYLKEYSVTENQLRVYTGFYSYLHIPRTSQKTLAFQVTCTTDSGSASTPTLRYSPATGLDPVEPEEGKPGVSMSATPVYSELWFILLLALLGLFLLAILLGLVLQRIHFNKSSSSQGLTDTKIVSSSSRFSPISVLRVPSETDLTQAYSQHALHRSVSQLIDRKSLMLEEGSWDNPLGHDSGLYVEEEEFVDAIKALSSGKKEHTMFTDTHL
uniref:Usher syndrome 2A (autosomal recessive, mild) n=1 Tax=Salarias fasciatus TaxID=181472 RepID=A0A672FK37_SALFA